MFEKLESKYLLVILIFVLVFSVSCGGDDTDKSQTTSSDVEQSETKEVTKEKDENDKASTDENNKASEKEINFYNLKTIDKMETLINLFEKIEYTWSSNNNANQVLKYEVVGQEKIENFNTDKISIKITQNNSEEEILLWVKDKNTIVKAKVKGKEVPGEFFENMKDSLFSSIFAPFEFAQGFMKGPIFNEIHDPIPGYETEVEKQGEKSLNKEKYESYKVTIKVGPPYSEEKKEIILNIADFGKYQLPIKLKTIDDSGIEFKVNDIVVK